MKRWMLLQVLAALLALGLLAPAKAGAQIPVTDAASLTEQVKMRLQTVLKLYQQYVQMKMQYDMAVESYNALVGARRISDIFDNPALRAYLPEDWVEMYDDVKNAGYNARSQSMQNIYSSYQAFDRCAYLKDTLRALPGSRPLSSGTATLSWRKARSLSARFRPV